MSFKEPGWSKLSQLVPDHIFRHEDWNKFLPVMYRERMSDHIGDDRRPSRPSLNDLTILILIHPLHFLEQMVVNKCALTD
jgi:hypothetical protein